MENQVTLTIEELDQFKSYQQRNQEIINILGQIEIQKLNLDISKDQIKQQMIDMSEEQNTFAQSIQSKYGEGQIDIEKGLFIPFPKLD
jgi:hypothetical protein